MNPDEASVIVLAIRANWPNFARTEESSELWVSNLSRLEIPIARRALEMILATLKHPPTIADWQEACRAAVRELNAHYPPNALPRGKCECELGWTFDNEGFAHRCPNECEPNPKTRHAHHEPRHVTPERAAQHIANIRAIFKPKRTPIASQLDEIF